MNTEPIPGVIALVKQGIAIYKQNFKTLAGLNVLYLAAYFLSFGIFAGSIFVAVIFGSRIGLLGSTLLILVGFAVMVFLWWRMLRVLLAGFYAVARNEMHPTIADAYSMGKGRVLEFFWVLLLTLCVIVGAVMILWTVALIVIFPLSFVLPHTIAPLAFVLLWIASFIAFIITGTWFAFSAWLFVDQDARGLHALALSKHLAHHHLGAIVWRVFGIGLLYVVSIVVLMVVFGIIFGFVPNHGGYLLAELLTEIILFLTVIPVVYASMFSLYKSVQARQVIDTDSKEHGEHRGILITLAVFGLVGICVMPAVFAIIGLLR